MPAPYYSRPDPLPERQGNPPTLGDILGQYGDELERIENAVGITGAVGDGATSNTTLIQARIDAVAAADGGGVVRLPAGTFLTGTLTLKSNVWLVGAGAGATILKLANGTNADMIVGEGFSGLTGGTTTGGITGFRISDITLDGNRANNTSGWPLRFYGYTYTIHNVIVRNGKSGGVWTQWGSGGTNMEAHWSNFKIYNCDGNLLDFNGPHDAIFVNGSIFNDGTMTGATGTLLRVGAVSSGVQFTNIHAWGICGIAIDINGGSAFFTNCQAEGATTVNVRFGWHNCVWSGGHVFGQNLGSTDEFGIQIGDSFSVIGNVITGTVFRRFADPDSRPIDFHASGGGNTITDCSIVTSACAALWTGTKQATDVVDVAAPEANVPQVRVGQTRTGIYLPGTSGNYISTVDAAALDVNDLDVCWLGAFANWGTLAETMVAKFGAAGQRSWVFRQSATAAGKPELAFSLAGDGTGAETRICGTAVPFTAWQFGAVRVTRVASTGVIQFYTAPDGGLNWQTLGTSIAGTAGNLFVGTRNPEVGSDVGGTANLGENITLRAQLKASIGGSVVADFHPPDGATRYRDPNGNIWTVNGSATAAAVAP